MELDKIKLYYNRCNPEKPREPGSELDVDFDSEWTGENRVRGENWADKLAKDIKFAEEPVRKFFTGLRGSGKTTELLRLEKRLAEQSGYCVVRIDAKDVIDLNNEIFLSDILFNVLHAAERKVLELEGRNPEKALQDGFLTRFMRWLSTEVEIKSFTAKVPHLGDFVIALKDDKALHEKVRTYVDSSTSSFWKEIWDELVLINERCRKKDCTGLVVIFDSLEKLEGLTSNWEKVLKSAECVFGGNSDFLRLPVHVLYTVPPALLSRKNIAIEFLPMLKIKNRDGSPFAPGIEAARELIRKRIPDDDLREMLGESVEERTKEVIEMSGGYPRDIVRMLQGIVRIAEYPVQDYAFRRVVNENSEIYHRLLRGDDLEWLAEVAVDKTYLPDSDDRHRSADRIMSNNLVMRYVNDGDWYDLHPGIRRYGAVERAIAKYKADKQREADGTCQQSGE